MVKILITGFKHSGTTMLMQLIRAHPQVGWIEFEEGYIEFDKSKEWIMRMASKKVSNLKEYAWGEKLPWSTRELDKKAKRSINFSKKWLKFFGQESRVLHILRHPYDVALSGSNGNNPGKKTLDFIFSSVPNYIDFVNSDSRCTTILYEDLLLNTKISLFKIFKFLNLKNDSITIKKVINTKLKFGKINPDRAYAYKTNSNNNLEIDYIFIERLKNRI